MLGCTLADKMTSTMPMMNHSFRTVAKRPMLKARGSPDHPAGLCQTAGSEFLQLSSLSSGRFSCHGAEADQEQLLPDTWATVYRKDQRHGANTMFKKKFPHAKTQCWGWRRVHANKTLTKIADEEKKIQKNNLRGFKRVMSNRNTTVNIYQVHKNTDQKWIKNSKGSCPSPNS